MIFLKKQKQNKTKNSNELELSNCCPHRIRFSSLHWFYWPYFYSFIIYYQAAIYSQVSWQTLVSVSCSVMPDSLPDTWTVAHQARLSTEISRQEYWSGLPFPASGNLPYSGIEPGSPAPQADSLPSKSLGQSERVSCIWLFSTSWTVAHQASLSMEFSRQECWSGSYSLL